MEKTAQRTKNRNAILYFHACAISPWGYTKRAQFYFPLFSSCLCLSKHCWFSFVFFFFQCLEGQCGKINLSPFIVHLLCMGYKKADSSPTPAQGLKGTTNTLNFYPLQSVFFHAIQNLFGVEDINIWGMIFVPFFSLSMFCWLLCHLILANLPEVSHAFISFWNISLALGVGLGEERKSALRKWGRGPGR